jgi:anti-sigma regulatory factor (Ser/Thr protein kinase)
MTMRAIPVEDESQVAEARRAAVALAASIGFDETERGRVAIVASELATNILKHAKRGQMLLGVVDDGAGAEVQCLALDNGPGIADLVLALQDGHSTTGTLGQGLGAVGRQSDLLEIYSAPGVGSAVLAQVRRDAARKAAHTPAVFGVVSLPKPGEEACGDAWSVRRLPDGLGLMVVDGLGHGPLAATAAHQAVKVYEASREPLSHELLSRMHEALRPTRGAAASLAWLPHTRPEVEFVGVGNVAGVVLAGGELRRMVSYNGTLGHAMKTVRSFAYPAAGETLVVLASDGLGANWSLESYPGLRQRHPALIAAVLYRDFGRGRDDVTVLVARRAA